MVLVDRKTWLMVSGCASLLQSLPGQARKRLRKRLGELNLSKSFFELSGKHYKKGTISNAIIECKSQQNGVGEEGLSQSRLIYPSLDRYVLAGGDLTQRETGSGRREGARRGAHSTAGVTKPLQYSLARRQSVSEGQGGCGECVSPVQTFNSGTGPERNHHPRGSPHLVAKVFSEPARNCRVAADETEIGEDFGSRVASAQAGGNPRTVSERTFPRDLETGHSTPLTF